MLAHSASETLNSALDCSIRLCRTVSHPPTRGGSADAKHPRHRRSEGLPSRSRRFASHPSVRARRSRFRSPHTSPAKCLRIPSSRLRTVHWTVQSGYAGPSLTPTHGAGQRMQSIRVTNRAKPCLRGAGASLPPLGSGVAVPIWVTSHISGEMLAHSAFGPLNSPLDCSIRLCRTMPHTSERTPPHASLTKNKQVITIG